MFLRHPRILRNYNVVQYSWDKIHNDYNNQMTLHDLCLSKSRQGELDKIWISNITKEYVCQLNVLSTLNFIFSSPSSLYHPHEKRCSCRLATSATIPKWEVYIFIRLSLAYLRLSLKILKRNSSIVHSERSDYS